MQTCLGWKIMKNVKKSEVLLIKNLPSALTLEERSSLLSCFGATDVRVMSDGGHMKRSAFATFADSSHATVALDRLHQIEILGSVLTAEYSSNITKQDDASLSNVTFDDDNNQGNDKIKKDVELSKTSCKCTRKLPKVSSIFGLDFSSNPCCKYSYPEPNSDILLNICGALLTIPKFYTQVLHLMNKMNLYAPFSPNTFIPPILMDHFCRVMNVPLHSFSNISHEGGTLESHKSSEESELEDDEVTNHDYNLLPPERATKTLKRKMKLSNSPKRKLARMKMNNSATAELTTSDQKTNMSEVFEGQKLGAVKPHISLSVPQIITVNKTQTDKVDTMVSDDHKQLPGKENEEEQGFGKLVPLDKPQNIQECKEAGGYVITKDFITEQQLISGRLSAKEMTAHPLFKNYNRGSPSCRLYVKNVSKKATQKDIQHIFGHFVNFSDEEEVKMFDVRVMTQGRMKGQAFVGLPTVEAAVKAVTLTNGYQLIDKPIVVSFARSAKPKDAASK